MLKWAVGKDDPINPTKSSACKQLDMQRDAAGLISGCCKHRNNLQGPSRILNKNRVRAVGVINNNNLLNNEFHNGKVNAHNYKAPDDDPRNQRLKVSSNATTITTPAAASPLHHNNDNNNSIINSDSKSLLYMSLDHLPMAIVKQYERMLQDNKQPPPKSVLKSQHVTNCSINHQHRPPNAKTKKQKQVSPPHKKPYSKSITFKDDVNESKPNNKHETQEVVNTTSLRRPSSVPVLNLKGTEIRIKEAQHRPLKVLSASISPLKPQPTSGLDTVLVKTKSNLTNKPINKKFPSQHIGIEATVKRKTDCPEKYEKSPKLQAKKSTLVCDKISRPPRSSVVFSSSSSSSSSGDSTVPNEGNLADPKLKPNIHDGKLQTNAKKMDPIPENDENNPNYIPKVPKKTSRNGHNFKVTNSPHIAHDKEVSSASGDAIITATGAQMPNLNDTTDPLFLEPKSITYSTPPVPKCAKKLTLKRSELKKLERLKTQTERLNRFLKKYYHDCLPNLPEEEEDSCSPEEKSVRLSILRTHWREVKSTSYGDQFLLDDVDEVVNDNNNILHSSYENVAKSYQRNRFAFSNPKICNKFSPLHSSSFSSYTTLPELSVDDYSVTWENLLNTAASPLISSYPTTTESSSHPPPGVLPIIEEDYSAEVSSSFNSEECHHQDQDKELVRDVACSERLLGLDESFLQNSRTRIETDDSLIQLAKESCLSEEHHHHHHSQHNHHDRMSDNFNTGVKISYDDGKEDEGGGGGSAGGEGEDGFGSKKLKGLLLQPLGLVFDPPASLEDEGFMGMSPYPPEAYSPASSSSASTFYRFSLSSSSGKGSTREDGEEHESEENYFGDDYDKEQSNLGRTSSQSSSASSCGTDAEIASMEGGGPKYIMRELKHENANYLHPVKRPSVLVMESCGDHNETWNSHGYVSNSPCGTTISSSSAHSSHSHHSDTTASNSSHSPSPTGEVDAQVEHDEDADETLNFNSMRNQRENDRGEESVISNRLALPFSTPVFRSKCLPQTRLLRFKSKKWMPRKVVRKPPVNSPYSGKGELLIRTYKNDGDYVTVHVVQARRLKTRNHSSWKLSVKVSCLPESETTFTRSSETIRVGRNKSWVKINKKFSFEIPQTSKFSKNTKVYLTAVKRLGKKSTFLGWTTLTILSEERTQCWLKLRKRKMSTTTPTTMQSYHSTFTTNAPNPPSKGTRAPENCRSSSSMDSPSPQPCHTDNGSSSSRCDCEMEPMQKSGLQNSSTMDSGVEDCCGEPPPPPAPSIDLDDKNGQRVGVRMIKPDGGGYGFSVVWVSPPRIERLEKGKTADLAGLRIGDLIISVNGEDVTSVPNTSIYTKMKTTGEVLQLEVWRTTPPIQSRSANHHCQNRHVPLQEPIPPPPPKSSSVAVANTSTARPIPNINEGRQHQQTPASATITTTTTIDNSLKRNINANANINQGHVVSAPAAAASTPKSRTQSSQPPPTSILKPPPPAPPTTLGKSGGENTTSQPQQSQPGSSSWRIRFNIELLDNEDDCLKQFFICELKFFRKIVAALDRYLIPAQSSRLLTSQEIHLIFANVIKIITVTKRILSCVASGSSSPGWNLGAVLLSTHSDHLSEVVSAYSAYAKALGYSSMILSDKMSLQEFARFVLEISVPKGHLDMTSLLFAPLEHLRNICEICEEISHSSDAWAELFTHLKECYADIVCETDFMEPISHVSMKKNPLLSVRDLEKRVVSTSCQPVKVCEKGRRWLFGSRLFKKESDGSWSPVWAFLFSDIVVLTSHTTRDRVFFVKESPIRLEDVVTLHFNLPRKHENEFRLLFEPEPVYHSRLDKLLPLHRNKKSSQIALRAPNIQLKSIWKLLLQRQIITLNTRLSKSASSNFSISEFCERFPITPQCEDEKEDHPPAARDKSSSDYKKGGAGNGLPVPTVGGLAKTSTTAASTSIFDRQNLPDERNLSVIKEERSCSQSKPQMKPYAPDGLSSMSKELLKSRVPRILPAERKGRAVVDSIPEEIKVSIQPRHDPTDTIVEHSANQTSLSSVNSNCFKASRIDIEVASNKTKSPLLDDPRSVTNSRTANPGTDSWSDKTTKSQFTSTSSNKYQQLPSTSTDMTVESKPSPSPTNNNNNNEIIDFNQTSRASEKCPCAVEKVGLSMEGTCKVGATRTARSGDDISVSCATKVQVESNSFDRKPPAVKPRTQTGRSSQVSKDASSENVKIESPRPAPRPDLQQRNMLASSSPSPAPSPSMSNNRVEALKYEGIGSSGLIKSKPGSKIMTNATLKSRHQELLAQKEGQTIITMVEKPSSNSANDTDCILISQHIEQVAPTGTKDTKDASSSPLLAPRCQSENGFVKPKSVHTDSPILTGFGSEKSRRRVLYDYKIQRDYPELFGISPKDRRSYIKQLAERRPDNDKPLIAPYYFSPLPTPKFAKRQDPVVPDLVPSFPPSSQPIQPSSNKMGVGSQCNNSPNLNTQKGSSTVMKISSKPVTSTAPALNPQSSKLFNDLKQRLVQQNLVESDADGGERSNEENEMSLEDMARGILRNVHSDEEEEEETDEDSQESDECQLGAEVRAQVHRQRSPEESSNDSGISDELTEKTKTKENNERFQSNVAVNSSEVKISSKISNSIVTHCDKMQLLPNKTAPSHACISSSQKANQMNTKIDLCHVCFEGEEKTGVEGLLVLKADKSQADKCTGTDDEYFSHTLTTTPTTTSLANQPEKPMRILMAERREAFFASYANQQTLSSYSSSATGVAASSSSSFRINNSSLYSPHHQTYSSFSHSHSSSSSSYARMVVENESPLKVKILNGGTLLTTHPELKTGAKSPPEERVQLMRFPEKERNARLEHVESSDDSTSSDLASASPAAENGTTDPSWSSSSSSLAGGTTSSKLEEPSTSMSTSGATSIYNSCPINNNHSQVASTSSLTKVFMSDFTNGLPSTSFCNGSLSLCGNSYGDRPEIVVTQESPETPTVRNGCNSDGEEDEDLVGSNGSKSSSYANYHGDIGSKKGFLRVGSNDSTVENFGDDDYIFDEEDELSQCSVTTINRYGTYESLEKIEESDDGAGNLPDFSNKMTRSKARFTFDDDDSDDDNDLFEEDFESDFNFRFPSQIQDNTYSKFSVSRLGPLPPLLEEDFEDDMYDEQRAGCSSAALPGGNLTSATSLVNGATLRARHETGLRHDNSFLLARLATMYARSTINSPLKILRDLWLKKRYRQSEDWKYKQYKE
ncbi:uncharacterized protein LOC110846360 isoform X4 [Folsomia candida]|nr:uncharacterized protein LOC110846360 isoform X4 [Folsomia candida]